MIVVLFESPVTPGIKALRDMSGLIIGERLGADEPGALHYIEERQQHRKKTSRPRCRKNLRRECCGCRLSGYRPSHSGPAAFAGVHFTSACAKVPLTGC